MQQVSYLLMYRKRISGFLICLYFALGLTAQQGTVADAAKGGLQVLRQQWNQKNGLPDWKVTAFLQDRQGLMWIAFNTNDELFTFDGYRFRAVKIANAPGRGPIVRLAEDVRGNIWMARVASGMASVDVLDPATETVRPLHRYLSLPNPVKIPVIGDGLIFHNIAGHIWIGSHEAIYSYDGTWKKIFASPGDHLGGWRPAGDGLHWYRKNNTLCLGDGRSTLLDSFHREGFEVSLLC